jgi:hypothetical protein
MRSHRFPQRHCQETVVNSRLLFQFAVVLLSVALPVGGQGLTSLHSVLKQGAIVDTSQNQEEGPRLVSSEIATSAMLLRFTHTDGGLVLHTSTPSAFQIAGADHKWFRADAHIVNGIIVVSTSLVQYPVAVRYAWPSNPNGTLFNGAGRPAAPFRTDDWPE